MWAGFWQRHARALGIRRAHVHADVTHLGRVTNVGLEVCGEVQHRLVVPAFGGEQQPLDIEVVHDGDVVLATAQAGLVDAHDLHAFEALQGTRLVDVELDAASQSLVLAAQQRSRLAHRQLSAQGQRQGLERCREVRSRSCPRHAELGGLAAAAAGPGHARHVSVQPSLELEEVQVPPLAAQTVVHGLRGGTASRTGQERARTADLEIGLGGRANLGSR